MCGICGFYIQHKGSPVEAIVRRMTASMVHRGPDDEGFFFQDSIGLGMRRLSIIDLSTGHQPIPNEDRSVWIVFNGEIYNFQELRACLEAAGHRFRTRSDTESIIHAYEEYGEGCVEHLRGMFAFAIWDERRQCLFVARDRLGIKPLYWSQTPQGFIFASEIKSILASGLVRPTINLEALSHFLSYGAVPAPLTMIEGISALPPAHVLRVEENHLKIRRYWDLPPVPTEPASEAFYVRRIRDLLEETIRLHQISDVPLGAFLSGGIDSSAAVALMSRNVDRPIRTFSVGFQEGSASLNELRYARMIAEKFGTDHSEVIVGGKEVLDELPNIIWYLDQPSVDGVNSYFVSLAARQGVTVALSGLGADEIFGGYPKFALIPRLMPFVHAWGRVPEVIRSIVLALAQPVTPVGRRRKLPGLKFVRSLESFYATSRMILWPDEKLSIFSEQVREALLSTRDSVDLLRDYLDGTDEDLVRQIARLEMRNYMGHMLLRDTDAMSMAHSLEVRVPWLDHKLVEFACAIPEDVKLKNGRTKHLLKESLEDILPEETINRRKQCFEFPLGYWLRHQLKPVVDSVLSRESVEARGLFRYQAVRRIYEDFMTGREPDFVPIWMFTVLELWIRRYMDGRDRLW